MAEKDYKAGGSDDQVEPVLDIIQVNRKKKVITLTELVAEPEVAGPLREQINELLDGNGVMDNMKDDGDFEDIPTESSKGGSSPIYGENKKAREKFRSGYDRIFGIKKEEQN